MIAEDTDVLILCLGFSKDISCLISYQKCGTQNRTRFLDINKLVHLLEDSVCDALVGMHAYTSCDTVSTFAGHGKMGTLKLMKSEKNYQEAFSELGHSWKVSSDLFEKLQEITCHMYVLATHTSEVNKLRHQMFCSRRGELESSQLPPCEDCLSMHTLHANYQTVIWRQCCKVILLYQVPRAMDGQQIRIINWLLNGCMACQHQMLSCSCSPASIHEFPNCLSVRASAMA